MCYKLGQTCVTNWISLVLLKIKGNAVTNWDSFVITNWSKFCYKLELLLQIMATFILENRQLLQIGTKFITNWGRYNKLG